MNRLLTACCCVAVAAAMNSHSAEASMPAAAADRTATAQRRVIVVLGDSLSVSPTPAQSFPAQLHTMLDHDRRGWTVVNAGVHGDTTAGGLRRAERLLRPDVAILVLALGANDGLRGVSLPTLEQNLSRIIEQAQARGIRVLLCGMETPPTRGWDYTLAFHHLFPRLAHTYDVPLVPFLLTGVALVRDMNGPDGVHPNTVGARRIAENVFAHLQPMLDADLPNVPKR
jgi:acyl-CoA thioesterase I